MDISLNQVDPDDPRARLLSSAFAARRTGRDDTGIRRRQTSERNRSQRAAEINRRRSLIQRVNRAEAQSVANVNARTPNTASVQGIIDSILGKRKSGNDSAVPSTPNSSRARRRLFTSSTQSFVDTDGTDVNGENDPDRRETARQFRAGLQDLYGFRRPLKDEILSFAGKKRSKKQTEEEAEFRAQQNRNASQADSPSSPFEAETSESTQKSRAFDMYQRQAIARGDILKLFMTPEQFSKLDEAGAIPNALGVNTIPAVPRKKRKPKALVYKFADIKKPIVIPNFEFVNI